MRIRLIAAVVAVVAFLVPASAWARTVSKARTGTLTVRIIGLPVRENATAILRGPKTHSSLTRSAVLKHLSAGRYTLILSPTKLDRSAGRLKSGATAYPEHRRFSVQVRSKHDSRIVGRYGTIVNPGVVQSTASVIAVEGPSDAPTSIKLATRTPPTVGTVLSIAPSGMLPRGVLEKITRLTQHGASSELALAPVSIYSVVPVAQFDVPLSQVAATPSLAPEAHPDLISTSCSDGSPLTRTISNIQFSGGWNTDHIAGVDVKVGVQAAVDFDADVGLSYLLGIGLDSSCEVDVSASGMAGPIPVTAAIFGQLSASLGAGLALSTNASIHVHAGASTVGVPPLLTWAPDLQFSNPAIHFTSQDIAEASASVGVGVKAGLGDDDFASLTLNFTNSVNFSAQPGDCDWDATFGAFSAEGKLLGWDIETPSTPPLYTLPLWHNACSGPVAPPPPPTPPNPVPGSPPIGHHVSAIGPTSGPVGLVVATTVPTSCPSGSVLILTGNTALGAMGSTADPDVSGGSIDTSDTQFALSVGVHQISFTCEPSGSDPGWIDPGFQIDLTSPQIPTSLTSTTVAPGGTLIFNSGAPDGSSPCPSLPDSTLLYLTPVLLNAPAGGVATNGGIHPSPTDTTEPLSIPSTVPAGQYLASIYCDYQQPGGASWPNYDSYTFGYTAVTVS